MTGKTRRHVGRAALALAVIVLMSASALGALIVIYGAQDQARPADVIIVLGAASDGNAAPGAARRAVVPGRDRAVHTVLRRLSRAGRAARGGGLRRPRAGAGVPASGAGAGAAQPHHRAKRPLRGGNPARARLGERGRGQRQLPPAARALAVCAEDLTVWTSPATRLGEAGNALERSIFCCARSARGLPGGLRPRWVARAVMHFVA